ncbi:hypothetical protein BX600DRAFT_492054 [Xylariales sp. PMI_506]|nr:hypothetical protein BX600DRAFT_492054 [Xylariales sp. PMI_506]
MVLPALKEITDSFNLMAQTTNHTAYLLAVTQILTVILLVIILIVLLGLLVTVNPDLATERQTLVTPLVRRFLLPKPRPAAVAAKSPPAATKEKSSERAQTAADESKVAKKDKMSK